MKDTIASQIQDRIDFLSALLPIAKNKRRLRGDIYKLRTAQRLVTKASEAWDSTRKKNG